MRILFLTALLLAPAMALAQDTAKPVTPDEVETIHSDAPMYVETITVDSNWQMAGTRPQDYRMGIGRTEGSLGPEAFVIRARPEARSGYQDYGTLVQWRNVPVPLLGKRMRLSARLKTENVRGAALWMRIDGKDRFSKAGGRVIENAPALAFYNMGDRPVRGTTGWKRYEMVLDVPEAAAHQGFGLVLIGGQGTLWADGIVLEEVGKDAPVSVMQARAPY